MSRNAVLEDKAGNQVMPITKGENVYYNNTRTANDMINFLSSKAEANSARIDSFTQLTDGSTTGDAELIDARIDYFGITHSNVGDAIRAILQLLYTGYMDISNLLEYDSTGSSGADFISCHLKNISLPVIQSNGSVEIVLPPHSKISLWMYNQSASPRSIIAGDLEATEDQVISLEVGTGGTGTAYQQIELFGKNTVYNDMHDVIALSQLRLYKPLPSGE